MRARTHRTNMLIRVFLVQTEVMARTRCTPPWKFSLSTSESPSLLLLLGLALTSWTPLLKLADFSMSEPVSWRWAPASMVVDMVLEGIVGRGATMNHRTQRVGVELGIKGFWARRNGKLKAERAC